MSRYSQVSSNAVSFAYNTFPRAPAISRTISYYSRASRDPDHLESAFAFSYSDVDLARAFLISSALGLYRVNVFVPMLVARQTDSEVELEVSSQ